MKVFVGLSCSPIGFNPRFGPVLHLLKFVQIVM